VQVTLWQLGREKSLIAKRSKMKGNSGHTSKANFGSGICEFESSHPSHAVRSLLCDFWPFSNSGRGAVAQQVQKVEGNTLQVKYKDGEKTIVVPSDAEVVNLVAGGKARLKTGAHVFIPRWEKQGDGTWQATVVVVGRDGITPPM
jgi:hypothetical protein